MYIARVRAGCDGFALGDPTPTSERFERQDLLDCADSNVKSGVAFTEVCIEVHILTQTGRYAGTL